MTFSLAKLLAPAAVAEVSSKEAPQEASRLVRIRKTNEMKRIVYGVVYAPNQIDTWGEYMSPDDVEGIAHRYMQLALKNTIDTAHDETPNGSFPVESFIAREGDPDFPTGAWVMGVKVVDDETWAKVLRGELNGFSYQAMVRKVPMLVEMEIQPEVIGTTEETGGHAHYFFVEIDDDGKVRSGRTSTDDGHSHEIRSGTATEPANGHSHRFFF